MIKTAIASPRPSPPVSPFGLALEVGGFLFFRGQVGQDPATGKVVEGDRRRDRAHLPESLGGAPGGRQEFRRGGARRRVAHAQE